MNKEFFPSSQAVLGHLEEVRAKVRRANSPDKLLDAITEFSEVAKISNFFQGTEWQAKFNEARAGIQVELLAGLRSAAAKIESLEQQLQGKAPPTSATPLFDTPDNPQTGTLSFPPTAGVLTAEQRVVFEQKKKDADAIVDGTPLLPPVIRGFPRDPAGPSPVAQSVKPPDPPLTANDFLVHPDADNPAAQPRQFTGAMIWICRKCKCKHTGQPPGGFCGHCQHGAFKLVENPDYPSSQPVPPETHKELAQDLQQMVDALRPSPVATVAAPAPSEPKFFTLVTDTMASCDGEDCGSDNLQIEAPIPDNREQYTVKYRCLECGCTGSFPCSKAELIEAQKLHTVQQVAPASPAPAETPKKGRPRKAPKIDPQSSPAAPQAPQQATPAPPVPVRADFLQPRPQAPASPQVKATVDRVVQFDPPGVNPVSLRDAVLASMRSWPPEKLIQEWETLLKKTYAGPAQSQELMREDIANFIAGVTVPGVEESANANR